LVRILVVDDFAPWQHFVVPKLRENHNLRVVGVVSDGLEAVLKAEELQPDLILLDIGLPTISGIEAARRIRKVAPKSKILFSTQEVHVDVARIWAEGKADAAIRLEELWNEIAKKYDVDILCGYSLESLRCEEDSYTFRRVCEEHSAVRADRSGEETEALSTSHR
jgi:CheY-like chemotaxis protein